MKISQLIWRLLKAWLRYGNLHVATSCYQRLEVWGEMNADATMFPDKDKNGKKVFYIGGS